MNILEIILIAIGTYTVLKNIVIFLGSIFGIIGHPRLLGHRNPPPPPRVRFHGTRLRYPSGYQPTNKVDTSNPPKETGT